MNSETPALYLASSSRHRAALLSKLHLPFQAHSPDVDETPLPGELPGATARRLAILKSRAIADELSRGLVIGSDQVASLNGERMGKPGTLEQAKKQLLKSAGQWVTFETGLALTDAETGRTSSCVDEFRVLFRKITEHQIERYLKRESALDCAGSFMSEGYGITLLERMEGNDPNSLIGLPMIRLTLMLREFGIELP